MHAQYVRQFIHVRNAVYEDSAHAHCKRQSDIDVVAVADAEAFCDFGSRFFCGFFEGFACRFRFSERVEPDDERYAVLDAECAERFVPDAYGIVRDADERVRFFQQLQNFDEMLVAL